jgi:hypothetical protein
VVSKERGERIAVDHGIRFLETSAKANINVDRAFYELAEAILDRVHLSVKSTKYLASGTTGLTMGSSDACTNSPRRHATPASGARRRRLKNGVLLIGALAAKRVHET